MLSGVSGLVVRALLDDVDEAPADPFADALRRYREEGGPDLAASWRAAISSDAQRHRAAEVLRHLTRDLLHGVSMPVEAGAEEPAVEAPPPNVRPITEARDVPALELASDGTWRPSSSSVSAQEEIDAGARRRSVPLLRSRYPQVARGEGLELPPAPAGGPSSR